MLSPEGNLFPVDRKKLKTAKTKSPLNMQTRIQRCNRKENTPNQIYNQSAENVLGCRNNFNSVFLCETKASDA